MPHVLWPALPDQSGALLLALMFQLDQSELLAPEVLQQRQLDALHRLLGYAVGTVPYYRDTPGYAAGAGQPSLTAEQWRRLPILSRSALQDAGPALRTEALPPGHEPVNDVVTTGSTGPPVRALGTRVTGLFWQAATLRDMVWHRRDMRLKLAAIRADRADRIPPDGVVLPNWAPFLDAAYPTGQCALLAITHDIATQARWLVEQDPDYLLSYPSNILALADHFRSTGATLPRLREVWTYGEALRPELRPACAQAWGVRVIDMYSCQEIGYIALQCPESHTYHVQSEAVYVEVLDGAGEPCRPGEVGRVVVSTLHNYATPLLRYELGDYAEMGGDCVCGRPLPVLNRIVGRERNMWVRPDGQRLWPMFSSTVWGHMDAIRQLQLVQHEVGRIQARVVGPRPLTAPEEDELASDLRIHFPWPFELTITCLPEIDRGQSMKFEDFVSFVDR
jgi:phenylacetate-CoA ligase